MAKKISTIKINELPEQQLRLIALAQDASLQAERTTVHAVANLVAYQASFSVKLKKDEIMGALGVSRSYLGKVERCIKHLAAAQESGTQVYASIDVKDIGEVHADMEQRFGADDHDGRILAVCYLLGGIAKWYELLVQEKQAAEETAESVEADGEADGEADSFGDATASYEQKLIIMLEHARKHNRQGDLWKAISFVATEINADLKAAEARVKKAKAS